MDIERERSPADGRNGDAPQEGRERSQNGGEKAPPPPRGRSANVQPSKSNVLGVFGLSIRTKERDIEDEFSKSGHVEKVVIVYDQRAERSRGFGFVTMGSTDDAAKAIEDLNGVELHGRRIRVDYSMTNKAHDPTPGQYMGFASRDDDRGPPPRRGNYERPDDRGYDRGYDRRRDDRYRDDYDRRPRYDDRRDDRRGYGDDRRYRERDYAENYRRSSRSPPRRSSGRGSRSPERERRPEY